jgi:hypothetical protein
MDLKWPDTALVKKHPRAILAILILFFLCVSWLVDSRSSKPEAPTQRAELEGLDTFIPDGFVMVPIEIQNLATVDSILGQYGVVDLYSEGESSAIGRAIKLIRSPRDPSQFAVLVPEHESKEIVRYSAKPFQIIVQNRQQNTSQFRKKARASRIQWED